MGAKREKMPPAYRVRIDGFKGSVTIRTNDPGGISKALERANLRIIPCASEAAEQRRERARREEEVDRVWRESEAHYQVLSIEADELLSSPEYKEGAHTLIEEARLHMVRRNEESKRKLRRCLELRNL